MATQKRVAMPPDRLWLAAAALLVFPAMVFADEAPAFPYDAARTATYLAAPAPAQAPGASSADLRNELSAAVDEILDGPWAPLWSDYSAAQAGGVGPGEWALVRPGDEFLALAEAAPYMTAAEKEKTKAHLSELAKACPPTQKVYVDLKAGKPRSFRKTPEPKPPWLSAEESQRQLFAEAYAVWAWADAFDAWNAARSCFDDLKKLRQAIDARREFAPAYKPGEDGVLTAAVAADPEYRFTVYESLISGFQDNYQYAGARAAKARMQKDKPVFFYVKQLASLVGYGRLAKHYGDADEAKWAEANFTRIAGLTLGQKASPYLWSDPSLVPEVARLLRDGAGKWLDELARTPNVGDLPARDWDGKIVPNKRDKRVINPYTWYHAWGGQGEGIRPPSVLGAFLASARLFQAPADRVAETRDIPWCKADLYYVRKLVVALRTAN
jgi:hypothetical protein